MALLHSLTRYVTIFFIMLVVLSLVVGAIAYYLLKVKKIASKEEKFDYSKFDRKDSIDYIRFDQIINSIENGVQTKNGLIVLNDGYRYIAGLKVSGYNFFSASAQEQHQSMQGMLYFLNAIEGDIQYRQSTKAIDLTNNIEKHEKKLKEVETELYGMQMDHADLVDAAEGYLNSPEIYSNYDKQITALEKAIKCKEHTQQELDIVIQYMKALSGKNLEAEKVQCWLFDWNYNSNDYTEELNDNEKYIKAAAALTTKANSYIAALSRTGCTCERMSAEEILELFRYHYSPITADVYKISDMYDSSVNALYVTSDSLSELEREKTEERLYFDTINEQRLAEELKRKEKEKEEILDMGSDQKEHFILDDTLAVDPSADESNMDILDEDSLDFEMDIDDDVPFSLTPGDGDSIETPLKDNLTTKSKKVRNKTTKKKNAELFDGQQSLIETMPFGNNA